MAQPGDMVLHRRHGLAQVLAVEGRVATARLLADGRAVVVSLAEILPVRPGEAAGLLLAVANGGAA